MTAVRLRLAGQPEPAPPPEPPVEAPPPAIAGRHGSARTAERGFLGLALLSLVLKVGVEAGLPAVLLDASLVGAAGCAVAALAMGRGRGMFDGWRLLLALSALVCVPQVHNRVGGDGIEYFAAARSLAFDQDLRFDNEFLGLSARPVRTVQGEATSRFPIGLPLLWIPPLLVCRAVAAALNGLGASIDTSGFGGFYQSAATTTSFALAVLGSALLESMLRRLFGGALAALTVLAIFFATPLHFYAVANPSMSHAASMFVATLFLVLWSRASASAEPRPWLLTGVAGALLSLIRIQDGVLLAMPALDAAIRRRGRRVLLALCLPAVGAALFQLVVWRAMYGPGFFLQAAQQGHFGRPELNVLGVLFSARHGFLTWTPVYLAALFGLLLWLRRDKRLALSMLTGLVLSVAINSVQWDWWGADSFGQRRLLGLTPIVALGLAEALALLRRRPLLPLGAGLALLVLWNQQFAYIYNSEMLAGKGQAVSLERLAPAQVDVAVRRLLRIEPYLPRRAFVLIYDNLRGVWLDEGPRSLGGVLELGDGEPEAFPIVGHGWSEPVRREGVSLRFSNVQRSWLRFPVMTPADFEVTLRIRAAFGPAPVVVSLWAKGAKLGEAALVTRWQEVTYLLPAQLVAPGVNEVALSYSLTPADLDPAFRGRNSAVALDWVRFRRRAAP